MTDGSTRQRNSTDGERQKAGAGGDLQQAVERFEQAVQELVGSATSEFSDRATSFLNETTSKLERELGGGGSGEFQQDSGSDGLVVIELEHADATSSASGHSWTLTSRAGASGCAPSWWNACSSK